MKTNIDTEEFRVPRGENQKLKEWPTRVKPFYKSKKRYHKLLEDYVDELSSLQRMHYASNRYSLLLIFQGMHSAGKDGALTWAGTDEPKQLVVSAALATQQPCSIYCDASEGADKNRFRMPCKTPG